MHICVIQLYTNTKFLKKNLDKETDNATDDEYVHDEHLKGENIKSHTQENLINRLLSKRFTKIN